MISNERKDKTRRERYLEKLIVAETLPISIATVNFQHEVNLAYVIRSAVCFGATEVCVIGAYPSRKIMNELSGSLFDYIKIRAFSNVSDFIRYSEKKDNKLISIELPPDTMEAYSIIEYEFDFSQPICLIVGHETHGIPADILFKSEIIYIDMFGPGVCLNTSQAANIALYEATKQYVLKE
jgi:tRNA G18 (ribose-2'-O)-methylase SpoU